MLSAAIKIPATLASTRWRRLGAPLGLCAGLAMVVAGSAIVTKAALRRTSLEPLSALAPPDASTHVPGSAPSSESPIVGVAFPERDPLIPAITQSSPAPLGTEAPSAPVGLAIAAPAPSLEPPAETEQVAWSEDPTVRWFNGRPVRPARTLKMTVTAYSPDERSCGPNARGITSSVHNVFTNAMKLVAADTRILPLGSMISVPGYDDGNIVPVLDRGGAIKGHRLDVLFPTHEAALKWGVKKLQITVWEYADGLPPDDYRKVRDSRN